MTFENPTLQRTNPPLLRTLLQELKREIFRDMNCAKIGVIQSFDDAAQTVVVKIAQQQVTSVQPDGTRMLAEYPLLMSVPVFFPQGGGFVLTFPIAKGDECLVLFNDRQIDSWLAAGAGQPPTTARMHDLSDGIAFVGIRSNPNALASVSTDSTQLRSDDGDTYVEVKNSGLVNVVAPTEIHLTAPVVVITASTSVTVDTPAETVTGTLNVENTGSSATPCIISGAIQATGDVVGGHGSANISLLSHIHSGVTPGGGDTGGPV